MALQVYTASLLKEGLVAYLSLENGLPFWTSDIRQATAGHGETLDALKTAAERSEQDNLVIAPYAIEVLEIDGGWMAATKREQIRAEGPTIRLPRDKSRESRQAA